MSPYLAEFLGTAILIILGEGVVANVVFCEVVGTFLLVLPIFLKESPMLSYTASVPTKLEMPLGLGAVGALPIGLIVFAIGLSLGGTTGYTINPARDLAPRLVHAIL